MQYTLKSKYLDFAKISFFWR